MRVNRDCRALRHAGRGRGEMGRVWDSSPRLAGLGAPQVKRREWWSRKPSPPGRIDLRYPADSSARRVTSGNLWLYDAVITAYRAIVAKMNPERIIPPRNPARSLPQPRWGWGRSRIGLAPTQRCGQAGVPRRRRRRLRATMSELFRGSSSLYELRGFEWSPLPLARKQTSLLLYDRPEAGNRLRMRKSSTHCPA